MGTAELNDVEEKVTKIDREQSQFLSDIKREKLRDSSKYTVELQRNQAAIKEAENKIRHVIEAVVQSIADIRDEISDDRISVRTEIKQHSDEIRRQGIAFERLFGRQQRNEHNLSDISQKCKQISRSICDISSESMSKLKSKSRMSDLRSVSSFYPEHELLDYRASLTDFQQNDRSSNNSNTSFE